MGEERTTTIMKDESSSSSSINNTRHTTSCCDTLVHYEWLLCGMGDLWGQLQSRTHLLAWWLTRHALYVGLVILLVVLIPNSIFPIVALLLVAHLYKIVRFLVKSSYQERQKRMGTSPTTGTDNTMRKNTQKDKNEEKGDIEAGTIDERTEE